MKNLTRRALVSVVPRFAVLFVLCALIPATGQKQDVQPPPCHPNPLAQKDMSAVATRGDIKNQPCALMDRLVDMAGRPHSQLPTQAYAEAHSDKSHFEPKPSPLFLYFLLDTTGFEQNPFA